MSFETHLTYTNLEHYPYNIQPSKPHRKGVDLKVYVT